MMNRIESAFQKPVFAAYFTAGDGGENYVFEISQKLEEAGVNLLEIGLPFSDPLADGPIIQQAMQRSLSNHTHPQDVLRLAQRIRNSSDIPLVLFSYFNPILAQGEEFLHLVKQAGFDGILIVDLPLEEASEFYEQVEKAGLIPIFIVTPSTSFERLRHIVAKAKGFIYYVLQKGTTGIREKLPEGFEKQIATIKKLSQIPVLAGFGVSNLESAKRALEVADGCVVGSAIVKLIGERQSPEYIKEFVQTLDPRREYVRKND